jgi:protoporphyrinogen oxidase
MHPVKPSEQLPVVVVGGGPAGLAALLELGQSGLPGLLAEQHSDLGGIARTAHFDGYRFDLGGHRFFTRVTEIEDLWRDLLGDDLLVRSRLSRICYQGRFYSYPLRLGEVIRQIGWGRALQVLGSYLAARLHPQKPEDNLEKWVSNRFGRVLFEMFFRSYTEKVWGLRCTEISADWAQQRIKDLSLAKAVLSRLNPLRHLTGVSTSLIEEFLYPRLGPGMMWEACAARAQAAGQQVCRNTRVTALHHHQGRIDSVTLTDTAGQRQVPCQGVISTMALPDLLHALQPAPPASVLEAAAGLNFRAFLTVALVVDHPALFPDNWIYIHDPAVQVGRIQNFRNWSPDLIPNDRETVVGLEYFCTAGDSLWQTAEADLVALATREMAQLDLLCGARVSRGVVERVEKAYPVYDSSFAQRVEVIRQYLETFTNLQTCGRNGLHRYNNLDHSMLTGIGAARLLAGQPGEVWEVNLGEAYLEER